MNERNPIDASSSIDAQLFEQARSMLRYAADATGNSGLVYGRCAEHDWRGRKRNVNNPYADPQGVRLNAILDAVAHLKKKHSVTE